MAKRGPKPSISGSVHLMPVSMIAARLGVSTRTVQYDLTHALRKLRAVGIIRGEVR